MNTKFSLAPMMAAITLMTLSVAVPAFSQKMDMSMSEHREECGQMMDMGNMDKMDDMMSMCIEQKNKIGLTDDQIIKIKTLHTEMQKKQARSKADMKIAGIELKEIMEVKDFDLEKADAAVKQISEVKTAHQLEMLKTMKEIRTILTDAQFKKMKELMMSMKLDKKQP